MYNHNVGTNKNRCICLVFLFSKNNKVKNIVQLQSQNKKKVRITEKYKISQSACYHELCKVFKT